MNPTIALITDSTCDIPANYVEKYGIMVVPQVILWGNQVLRDRVDLQAEAFYRRLATDRLKPSSSQPPVQDFVRAYRQAVANGVHEIIVVTVSSTMSGTFGAAQKACEQVDVPVHVIDARGPTMSLGWQVLAAARLRASGGDAIGILEKIKQVQGRLVQYVCLDTLEFLHRGGRIGNAAWLAGSLLNIKPLLKINHVSGLVESSDRVRTRSRSIELLYERFFAEIERHKPLRVAVLHGDAPEDARRLADRIQREFNPAELLVNTTGPVLGIHTGPRALALCGYTED